MLFKLIGVSLKAKHTQERLLSLYKTQDFQVQAINILSFNENDNGGGFRKLNEPYLPPLLPVNGINPSNGLSYFLFDNVIAIKCCRKQKYKCRLFEPNI